ncbi:MAG: DUF2281 domain-containing protein [Deltaproteobacteria bacterium]|nr:DUF2281 domain-containing protein [Deltaproteobacteria bacterium]
MTIAENIHQYVQMLPDTRQQQVLDFVRFLLFKREQETTPEQDEIEWSNFSLASAMRGMEDEDTPIYTTDDLKEVFT